MANVMMNMQAMMVAIMNRKFIREIKTTITVDLKLCLFVCSYAQISPAY